MNSYHTEFNQYAGKRRSGKNKSKAVRNKSPSKKNKSGRRKSPTKKQLAALAKGREIRMRNILKKRSQLGGGCPEATLDFPGDPTRTHCNGTCYKECTGKHKVANFHKYCTCDLWTGRPVTHESYEFKKMNALVYREKASDLTRRRDSSLYDY
jgi:hypothetical protein